MVVKWSWVIRHTEKMNNASQYVRMDVIIMSGYHCVDYCQDEPQDCRWNEKMYSTAQSNSIIWVYLSVLHLYTLSMQWIKMAENCRKCVQQLSIFPPLLQTQVESGKASIVMVHITLLYSGVDILTNTLIQITGTDKTVETQRAVQVAQQITAVF